MKAKKRLQKLEQELALEELRKQDRIVVLHKNEPAPILKPGQIIIRLQMPKPDPLPEIFKNEQAEQPEKKPEPRKVNWHQGFH